MSAAALEALLVPALLASLRILAALALLPLAAAPGSRGTWLVRVLIAAPLVVVVWPVVVPQLVAAAPLDAARVARIALHELAVGLALGIAAALVLSAGRLAGGMLDAQLPGWRAQGGGAFAGVAALAALTLFVTLGGHIVLMEALIVSFATLPPAEGFAAVPFGALAGGALERAAALLVVALSAVLPALVAVALAEVLAGIAERVAHATRWPREAGAAGPALRTAVMLLAVLATMHAALSLLARWMIAQMATLTP